MGKEKILIIEILIADILLMSATVALTFIGAKIYNPFWIGGFNNLPNLILLYDTSLLACNTLYPSIIHNRLVKIESVIQRSFTVSLLLLLLVSLLTSLLEAHEHFPRTYTLTTIGLFTFFSIIERIIISKLLKYFRRNKRNLTHVVLVGKENTMFELLNILSIPHYGYEVLGTFYEGTCDNEAYEKLHIGDSSQLYSFLASHTEINEVYGNFTNEQEDRVSMLSKYCDNHLIRFFIVPTANIFKGNVNFTMVDSIPVMARREEPLANPFNRVIKRLFDILFSAAIIILIFPWVFVIAAIIIKIQSPGPIFFKQDRTGIDGRIFKCLKFRTMKVNDDADEIQATEHDPRKYPFGNFMRKTNIDELPQFINVLLGDMSIVGPRPHMLKHTEEYSKIINHFMVRHLAKPGITGLAQVSGYRGETKHIDQMEGRIRMDIEYIENWTFLLDIKIICKTILNMFQKEENAY